MRLIQRENTGLLKPSHDLVVVGYPGFEATKIIAKAKYEELKSWYREAFINEILETSPPPLKQIDTACESLEISEYEVILEGGLFTALWNLSGGYGLGLEVYLREVHFQQATIEVCERYQLNPYRLRSKDCLLLTSPHGFDVVRALHEQAIFAKVIGKVTNSKKREVIIEESRGYMEGPKRDELYKLIKKQEVEG